MKRQIARRRAGSTPIHRVVGVWLALILVLLLVGVPIWSVIQSAFREGDPSEPGKFTLSHVSELLGSHPYFEAALNSCKIALIAGLVALPVGFLAAWIVTRTDVPLKSVMRIGNLIPYLFPIFLGAIGWAFLASPRAGLLNVPLVHRFPPRGPFNIYSLWGVGLVLGTYLVPIVYVVCSSALTNMDGSLEDAARVTGSSEWSVLCRITIPMMRPALLGSAILVVVLGLEDFGVPQVLGTPARISVIMTQVYNDQVYGGGRFGASGVLCLMLLLLIGVLAYVYRLTTRYSYRYATVTSQSGASTGVSLGHWRYPVLLAWAIYFCMSVVLPIGTLVYLSLRPYVGLGRQVGFENYRSVLHNSALVVSIKNSLSFSFVGATIGMIIATSIAIIVGRSRVPGVRLLDVLATVPLAIPGVVLGLSMLWFWVANPLTIYGTPVIIILVLVTKFVALGQRTASSALIQISPELMESAAVCGGSPARIMTGITLPLMRAGLLSGWALLFLSMFREVGGVIVLSSAHTVVLPVAVLQSWDAGALTSSAALASIEAVLALVFLGIFGLISRGFLARLGTRGRV